MVPFFQLRNGHAEFLRNAGKRVAFHNMIGAVWRSAFLRCSTFGGVICSAAVGSAVVGVTIRSTIGSTVGSTVSRTIGSTAGCSGRTVNFQDISGIN